MCLRGKPRYFPSEGVDRNSNMLHNSSLLSTNTYTCGVTTTLRMHSVVFVIMHIYRIGKWVFLITKFNVGA